MIAEHLSKLAQRYPINLVFKSSFDKANRTRGDTARGVGIEQGLKILAQVRAKTGLPVLTDVHESAQVPSVAEAVDVLQIPAFLCRQTDLLFAAGKSGKAVNVKKGQFLAPEDMRHVASKIASTGNKNVMLCERGTSFGYHNLVVDMRGLVTMRQTGYPVIFDGTHSVQTPSSSDGVSGGMREFIHPLVRAAAAVGIDGLFLECHQDPDRAPSDAASMLALTELEEVVASACRIREATVK